MKTTDELRAILDGARESLGFHGPCRPSWLHNKTGLRYEVESVALRESDQVPMVVYRRSGIRDPLFWTRPLEEFLSKFTEEDA